jgi:transposase
MKIIHRRCAGLDIHKKTISACIRIRVQGHKIEIHEAVFGTFTQDLERLRDWLKQYRVKQVAMESTGVYWIPVWNVLELVRLRFELILVNPQTVRALRGHKTDRIDAARIAEFLQYGLLRGSFVPPRSIRELRDLTRSRVHLQQDRNRVINRIGRLLETANVKLGSVASNIVGASGRAILAAIVAGRTQPEQLAERALGSLQAKKTELALALQGRYSEHFRWLLGRLLQELEWLDDRVLSLDARLSERLQSCTDLVRRLDGIPGIDRVTAWALIAELGLDMRQFPDAAHVASWAGLCPGNQKSAGKRFSGRTRKGDRYLRRLLTQSAWAVLHKDNCFLTALFYRVARRRGEKKAAIAVAHRILTIAYQIIRDGGEYREIGGDYFDRLHPERTVARLTRRLERFGYTVLLHARNEEPDSELLPAPRRRGRPCLCAARGLPCAHTRNNQLAPAASPSATASPLRTRPVHTAPPTPPSLQPCSKCQKWGVPCIHARNQKLHAPPSTSAPESVT